MTPPQQEVGEKCGLGFQDFQRRFEFRGSVIFSISLPLNREPGAGFGLRFF